MKMTILSLSIKRLAMVVHPGYGNYKGTLVNALSFHFKNLPHNGNDAKAGFST